MGFPVTYDEATRPCSPGPTPGALALRSGSRERYPHLTDLGIYNCRDVGGTSVPSIHGNGRAWDAGTPTFEARMQGQLLALQLVAHHAELGVQAVIWNRQAWSTLRPYWRAYTGADPHTGHLHIELTVAAGRGLTLEAVRAALAPPPILEDPATMFFAKLTGTREVFLFEQGRYTHMKSRAALNAIAKAADIPNVEAELDAGTWAALTKGRVQFI